MPRSPFPLPAALALVTLLGIGCAGPTETASAPPAPVLGTLTVAATNPPEDRNVPITYSLVGSGDYVSLALGEEILLAPGRYVVTSRSQLRDGHRLFRVAAPTAEVLIQAGDRIVHTIAYTPEDLPPATLTFEVAGLPAGVAPRVYRSLLLSPGDAAVVVETLPANQARTEVPAAAGTWALLPGRDTLQGRTYEVSYDQTQVTLASGATATLKVTYTPVP